MVLNESAINVGGGGEAQTDPQWLAFKLANRHGLIAGATGTGKTITMQVLAEEFSRAGVPVFLTDIKGDVAGMALAGEDKQWQKSALNGLHCRHLSLAINPLFLGFLW